jgi:hypothetical protein
MKQEDCDHSFIGSCPGLFRRRQTFLSASYTLISFPVTGFPGV